MDERLDERAMFLAKADAIAAMTPKNVKQTDSALLLREMRGRASLCDKIRMATIALWNKANEG